MVIAFNIKMHQRHNSLSFLDIYINLCDVIWHVVSTHALALLGVLLCRVLLPWLT